MPFVKFGHTVKYNGEFYDAGIKIKVDESDLIELKQMGAEEIDGRIGKNRKQTFDIEE